MKPEDFPKTDAELVDYLLRVLVPQGTADVVCLRLNEPFFKREFIHSCINEIQTINREKFEAEMLGDRPRMMTPLEKLALLVLTDAAYLTLDRT